MQNVSSLRCTEEYFTNRKGRDFPFLFAFYGILEASELPGELLRAVLLARNTAVCDSLYPCGTFTVTIARNNRPVQCPSNATVALTIVCVIIFCVFHNINFCHAIVIHYRERPPPAPSQIVCKTTTTAVCTACRVQQFCVVISPSVWCKLYGIQWVCFQ